MSRPLLEVRDLHVHFDTPAGVLRAVNGVSLSVAEGETVGIVGESGCGKSVTAHSIMGLVPSPPGRIAGGQVLFEDRDLLRLRERGMRRVRGGKIAMIFQDPMTSLNPTMTIGEQIGEMLKLHLGMSPGRARRRAIELLAEVGIPAAPRRVDQFPHQLSGGMRQRVMIAMAISCSPRLLIADEPTTALDVTIQAQILDLIRRLGAETGTAVIVITHDLGVIAGLADRLFVMYAGHIVETGPADQLFHDPRHPYTKGLLRSTLRIDQPRTASLTPIEGSPPDLLEPVTSCPFQPRCEYAVERSRRENPPLEEVAPEHWAACWVDVRTGRERQVTSTT